MCICKRSSPKSNTTRTINKNMPPPPPPPILDPFFVDTCHFFKQSSPPREQQAPAATIGTTANAAAAAAADTTDAAADQAWRLEAAFLSGVEATADARSGGQEGDASAGGAVDVGRNDDGARALQNFLGSGNSAWMESVRDMEAEKNDMLRLDVRRSPK
ncbi:unnamed protein product [Ectocarpus fasciculatus]